MNDFTPAPLVIDDQLCKQLPNAKLIYTKLREGVHIAVDALEHYALYKELEKHAASYEVLFNLLGYELVYNTEGFFYFRYPDSVTSNSLSTSRKIALMIFTLVDYLQDNNFDPSSMIQEQQIELSLFEKTQECFKDLYTQADMAAPQDLTSLLEWMSKRGFCQIFNDTHVKFCKPIERFLAATEAIATQKMIDKQPEPTVESAEQHPDSKMTASEED
ncbi:chromosome partition protein MukE [Zooshikella sp. RANM57]|uniref:chromosome partition protein MukE n=1 Tax=Zooshikella sp. RANM57 TaxID=3425863 RepID=UPI003D6F3E3F